MIKKSKFHCLRCKKSTQHTLISKRHGSKEGLFYKCKVCGSDHVFYGEIVKRAMPIILLFIILGCHKPEIKQEPPIEFKIKLLSYEQVPISGNYTLEIYNNISNQFAPYREGNLDSSYNVISNIKKNNVYRLTYWSDGYYKKDIILKYRNSDYLDTLAFEKKDKKSPLNITIEAPIFPGSNEVILKITPLSGSVKAPIICSDNSMRIIDVQPKYDYIAGAIYNWSKYPHNDSVYDLPKNNYYVNGYLTICDKADWHKCYPARIDVPEQLKRRAVRCFRTVKDIEEEYSIPLVIRAMEYLGGDYIQFYIIDKEGNMFNYTKLI